MWLNSLQYNIAKALNYPFNPQGDIRVHAMLSEFERRGGLKFNISRHKDGWMAECTNVAGIITGNTNPKPSDEEIDMYIKDAIFSAFGIPAYLCNSKLIKSDLSNVTEEKELVYG